MFGDTEGMERVAMTEQESEKGIIEIFVEERSSEWFITYYVYKDKCIAEEYMNGNPQHCVEECDDLKDAIATAGHWC